MTESEQTTLPVLAAPSQQGSGDFFSLMLASDTRAAAWGLCEVISKSSLVPKEFQGKPADVMLALQMASRLGTDQLMTIQNISVISGRPTLSAKFQIALANTRGPFRGGLGFRQEGEGKGLKVTCYATLRATGEEVAEAVTMEMAEKDGWTKNPKYLSLPGMMLTYRAACFMVRKYCPEVVLGLYSTEELEDVSYAHGSEPRRETERIADKLNAALANPPAVEAVEIPAKVAFAEEAAARAGGRGEQK